MSEIAIGPVDAGSEPARWAMTQYFTELDGRFPEGFDATGALDGAAAYNPPSGLFLLATLENAIVGCAALRYLDDSRAEAKRMWVSPGVRGQGLATRLLGGLEEQARAAGRLTLVLDTHASLTEAISLYERHGYVRVVRYNDNPYAQLWFSKKLGDQSSSG